MFRSNWDFFLACRQITNANTNNLFFTVNLSSLEKKHFSLFMLFQSIVVWFYQACTVTRLVCTGHNSSKVHTLIVHLVVFLELLWTFHIGCTFSLSRWTLSHVEVGSVPVPFRVDTPWESRNSSPALHTELYHVMSYHGPSHRHCCLLKLDIAAFMLPDVTSLSILSRTLLKMVCL